MNINDILKHYGINPKAKARGYTLPKLPPHHYLNRQSKRAKDHVRYWMYQGSSFERLNPEE
jgi:hypothetical protein